MRLRRYFTERMRSEGACEHCIEFMGETKKYGPHAPTCDHSPEDMRKAYSVAATYALSTERKPKPIMRLLKDLCTTCAQY
jgi:hypothetical protein